MGNTTVDFQIGDVVSMARYISVTIRENEGRSAWDCFSLVPRYGKVVSVGEYHGQAAVEISFKGGPPMAFSAGWLTPLSPIEQLAFAAEEV